MRCEVMNKKYEFTDETIEFDGRTLHRIRTARDFGNIKKGELGGFIEKEENLSHNGNAWVCGNARVCGDAQVYSDARVYGNACVHGDAQVYRTAQYMVIGPIGSRNDFTTFCHDKENEITVKCGCFNGKMGDFLKAVEKKHGDSKHGRAYRLAAELARAQVELEVEE